MATTLSFKDIIDIPTWRPSTPAPASMAAGSSSAYDMRNTTRNTPLNFLLLNATSLYAYLPHNDEWWQLTSPALTGTFGAGATCIFHPTIGPRGTIAAGATNTTLTLTTALAAAVGVNQLANRGDGAGFTIRIIGNASGSSGKTEERIIVANTAGTTPTITLDTPLSFSPILGDAYEIRSGRLYMLSAGVLAAGMFKAYDVATNSVSGNLATTNLPATVGGDSSMVALSEGHIPNGANVSEGFLAPITATASSGTTITAGTLPGSANLFANEYANFQVRIVQDTGTPTAVGQRRVISSHTSGTTPVFTVAAWAVTPSATATFVVENIDDRVLLFTNQTSIYHYSISGDAWSTATYTAAANAGAAGIVAEQSFGIARDTTGNARHSFIYRIRGGNVNTIDVFDMAANSWSADIAYGNKSAAAASLFTTGTCGAYDPVTNNGRYLYLSINGGQRLARFDVRNRVLEPWKYINYPQGTATVGARLSMAFFFDGSTKLSFLYAQRSSSAETFSIACQR